LGSRSAVHRPRFAALETLEDDADPEARAYTFEQARCHPAPLVHVPSIVHETDELPRPIASKVESMFERTCRKVTNGASSRWATSVVPSRRPRPFGADTMVRIVVAAGGGPMSARTPASRSWSIRPTEPRSPRA